MLGGPRERSGFPPPSGGFIPPLCSLFLLRRSHSIVGEGEWATVKHGGRGQRGWKKLHLGVDRLGVIVAHTLTEAPVDDATTGIVLIEVLDADIERVTGDAAYDTIAFYD